MFALACADEILGHWTEAASGYELAVKAAPASEPVRERTVRFYLRAAQPKAALPHLLALFPPIPNGGKDSGVPPRPRIFLPDALLPWARRQLALTLVDIDPQANRERALTLLGPEAQDATPADLALNARARSFIQAADPAERGRLRTVLEAQAAAMGPEELFRLAQLADADGDSGRALAHARAAWEADNGNPEYLVYLIRGLVKMNQREEGRHLLALLTEKEGDSERCRELRAALEKQ